jgi:hypothetical protein
VQPTVAPTVAPTTAPTVAPTIAPTVAPTLRPTPSAVVIDDHGNTPANASAIAPGPHAGAIAPPGDVDFFRITVPATTQIAFELRVDTLSGAGITLFNGSGAEVADEELTGPDKVARGSYLAREGGTYFARVRGARPDFAGSYTLSYTASAR